MLPSIIQNIFRINIIQTHDSYKKKMIAALQKLPICSVKGTAKEKKSTLVWEKNMCKTHYLLLISEHIRNSQSLIII